MSKSRRQRLRAKRRERQPRPSYGGRVCGTCCHWRGFPSWHIDGRETARREDVKVCYGPGFLCNTVRAATDAPCGWHRTASERPHRGPDQLRQRTDRNFPRDLPERASWAG